MNMQRFSDVNLDQVIISQDGKSVEMKFCDMSVGKDIGSIKCSHVFIFKYQNTFEDDDGFACYIGEVVCEKLIEKRALEVLSRLGYGFYGSDSALYKPSVDSLFHLQLVGGEVMLDIVCGAVDLSLRKPAQSTRTGHD